MELRHRRVERNDDNNTHESSFSEVQKHLYNVGRKLKRADMFPKPKEDYQRLQTAIGAKISFFTVVVISILVLWESVAWVTGRDAYDSELVVANFRHDEGVPINIDITFPNLKCPLLHLDVMDAAGGARIGIHHHLMKGPVTADGKLVFSKRYNSVVEHENEVGRKAVKLLKSSEAFGHRQRSNSNRPYSKKDNDTSSDKIDPEFIQQAAMLHQQTYNAEDDPSSPEYCGQCYIDQIQIKDDIMMKDVNDIAGEGDRKLEINKHHMHHTRNSQGRQCCNTCQSVMDQYDLRRLPKPEQADIEQCVNDLSRNHPGCNIQGTIFVQKVQGEFHFKPGVGMQGMFGEHIHQYSYEEMVKYDPSHVINRFSIGRADAVRFLTPSTARAAGGRDPHKFPLEGLSYAIEKKTGLMGLFDKQGNKQGENSRENMVSIHYFLNIVPTAYVSSGNILSEAFEYSAQRNFQELKKGMIMKGLPGVTFSFDFNSMQINQIFKRPPLTHFLVEMCSLVGGLFVVIGLLDRVVTWYLSKI